MSHGPGRVHRARDEPQSALDFLRRATRQRPLPRRQASHSARRMSSRMTTSRATAADREVCVENAPGRLWRGRRTPGRPVVRVHFYARARGVLVWAVRRRPMANAAVAGRSLEECGGC
jgi:hypothetical protein